MTDSARPDFSIQAVSADPRSTRQVAEALASTPGAIERALGRHTSTADGRCTECEHAWPCAEVNAALLARVIASGAS